METKTCKVCGRELPEDMFMRTKSGGLTNTCRECRTAALRANREFKRAQVGGGVNRLPFPTPTSTARNPREVIDIMVRCRKWLESRGFEIAMTCVYKEIKIRKIKLE